MGVYVFRNNQVEGPFDELVLQQALANGTMSAEEQVCREGSQEWTSASQFFYLFRTTSAPVPKKSGRSVPNFQSFPLLTWIKNLSTAKRFSLGCGVIFIFFIFLICLCATYAPVPPGIAALQDLDPSTKNSSSNPVTYHNNEEIKGRLTEIKHQKDEITSQSTIMIFKGLSLADQENQLKNQEQTGYYVDPDKKAELMKEVIYYQFEIARLATTQKSLEIEEASLNQKLNQ